MKSAVCLLAMLLIPLAMVGCAQPDRTDPRAPLRTTAASQPEPRPDVHATTQPQPSHIHRQEKIAEADALFLAAVNTFRKLQSADRLDRQPAKAALDQLLRMIRDYPQSDKVDDAYFYAAELVKEYWDDDQTAATYYRLAYDADPATPHPARFQRAMLLDFRLHQRAIALEEYRNAIRCESGLGTPWARSNADFATIRIRYLEGKD